MKGDNLCNNIGGRRPNLNIVALTFRGEQPLVNRATEAVDRNNRHVFVQVV